MKFLVMGAGALGTAFGGMLAAAGNDVTLIGRERHMKPIRDHGLRISGIWGSHLVKNLNAKSEHHIFMQSPWLSAYRTASETRKQS